MVAKLTIVRLARIRRQLRESETTLRRSRTLTTSAVASQQVQSAIVDVLTAESYIFRALRKLKEVRK